MKRMIPILAVLALAICSCNNKRLDDVILSDDNPKLIVRSTTLFSYSPDHCQLAYNERNASFRMMTDDMSEFVSVTLNHVPSIEGETVIATELSWTTWDNLEVRNDITLEVLQLKGDAIWLWYPRERIALVLKILE